MTYELAKELKDAGFSQKVWAGTRFYIDETSNERVWGDEDPPKRLQGIVVPTLSELIGACGGKFEYLNRVHGKIDSWFAGTQDDYAGTERSIFQGEGGSTPEEAVAKLYLALHEKKD